MVNNLNNNLLNSVLNGSLSNQGVSSVKSALEGYSSTSTTSKTDLVDESNISKEALLKYQTEQEIAYYKNILNAMLGESDSSPTSQVAELIGQVKEGNYEIDDSTLATAILGDDYAQTLLDLLKSSSSTSTTGTTQTTAASNNTSKTDTESI